MFREGDLVLIQIEDKKYLKKLTKNFHLNVKDRTLRYEDVIGRESGDKVGDFYLFEPTLEDIILLGFERKTQIIYPKDAFYIAFKLGIDRSSRVLEFGTGSGALTAVLSHIAMEVYSYEQSEKFYQLALRNWERFQLCKNVRAFLMDFSEATLEEESFDAAFVDVREPWHYVDKVHRVLKRGAVCGFLLPTTNQVCTLLSHLNGKFASIEVLEIFHRYYKTNPERFRPEDRMVAHTAYLVFGRKIKDG
ncbi:Methyltransferase type 11 [Thermocrinis albus DSM 14484]|uniref:tRNA (adenine(58)-N(1))-methyltransferase TrmI n=1 Tax=Thermocrinis albus (strain DSM 14484 / JCM 11386 / HI 11/12) TaxID=638303 RepID=D3SNC6_THEAH|nr:tRNA (adenine-N1)-methyltransferase [Thermocrinis albus]ADC88663.1 Methyltransferase type 11 [Thermocrinis albus DSM 14484]